MSITRIASYKNIGVDLDTTWGRYSSPYVVSDHVSLPRDRMASFVTRTSHHFRQQPRNLSDPTANVGWGADDTTSTSSTVKTAIFVGVVAGAYLLWAAMQPQRRRA